MQDAKKERYFCEMPRILPIVLIATIVFVGASGKVFASKDDSLKNSIIAYPVGFYLPETRFGAGVAGAFNFRFNKKDKVSPPSQLQFGVAYTQNRQFLLYLPFDFYFRERKHQLSGELGYYQYLFFYYGTSKFPQKKREVYEIDFPRLRIQYTYKLRNHLFSGLKYWWDRYHNGRFEPEGELIKGRVPGVSTLGSTGGLGMFFLYDNRDNVYCSKKGVFIEASTMIHDAYTISDYRFQRWRVDARYFHTSGKKSSFAFQGFADMLSGNVPFFQMNVLGNSKRMRGYVEGRYRGHQMILFQSEWRWFPFERWGATLFGSLGSVEHNFSNHRIGSFISAGGVGLRFIFDQEKRIHIRLDYALGRDSQAVYFTIGESF